MCIFLALQFCVNDVTETTLQASNILTTAQQAMQICAIQSRVSVVVSESVKANTSNQVSVVVSDSDSVCVQLTLLLVLG